MHPIKVILVIVYKTSLLVIYSVSIVENSVLTMICNISFLTITLQLAPNILYFSQTYLIIMIKNLIKLRRYLFMRSAFWASSPESPTLSRSNHSWYPSTWRLTLVLWLTVDSIRESSGLAIDFSIGRPLSSDVSSPQLLYTAIEHSLHHCDRWLLALQENPPPLWQENQFSCQWSIWQVVLGYIVPVGLVE